MFLEKFQRQSQSGIYRHLSPLPRAVFTSTPRPIDTAEQGLLQGSVLSALHFLLYINDLKTVVPKGAQVAMFADDVSLVYSHPCKLAADTAMQDAVTRVVEWNSHYKMTLNPETQLAFGRPKPNRGAAKNTNLKRTPPRSTRLPLG